MASQLRDEIEDGLRPRGARLPNEVVLAEQFGVSRATLREALRLLAAQSLIRTSKGAGGGSYVTVPSAEDLSESLRSGIGLLTAAEDVTLEQLLEARELLEVPAAELAARRRVDGQVERLRASIPGDPLRLGPQKQFVYNADFHSLVIESCGNVLLSIAAQPIFAVLQTRLARSRLGRPFHRSINEHHREIADAIESGDESAAGERMYEHLGFLRPYYERAWREVQALSVSFGIQGSGQQLGSSVPDGGRLRDLAQAAEELGYDSIWAGDHISYRNPILDVVVALSTFAAATERITIGAGIVLLPLRHPSVVAKEFASLDHVSGGRVILGVGVGGESAKDFEAVGVDPRERGARTDEAMQALRELFRGHASFSGRFFSFEDVEIEPGPARPGGPPLWVGGRSPAAIRRAAVLGDGWIPIWVSVERFREGLAQLPAHVVPAVTLPAHVGDKRHLYEHLRQRYAGDFTEHVVDRYCVAGTLDECAARVREYVDAGAGHIVFNLAEPEDAERLAEVVLAAAR